MDYIFIVNPKSRTGQGELLWSQLEPELKKRRVSYEVRMTGRKKDAERIATEITADEEEHTMIVLGGDGSLNEVINGIKNPSKVTLGYIPTGSSNDFARGMGIPKDAKKALELILNSEKMWESWYLVGKEDDSWSVRGWDLMRQCAMKCASQNGRRS